MKFVLALASLLMLACGSTENDKTNETQTAHQGSRDSSSQQYGAHSSDSPLIVLVGGNKSCDDVAKNKDMGVELGFKRVFEPTWQSQRSSSLERMSICIEDHKSMVRWTSPSSPERWSGDAIEISEFVADVFPKLTGGRELILIGFSYGGFLSLKTTAEGAQNVGFLATIDPISPHRCKKIGDAGCNSFPPEFKEDPSLQQTIADRTKMWVHNYQRIPFVRSGPALDGVVDRQTKRTTIHTLIDSNSTVWQDIADNVLLIY